jgi:hypothetical protein
MPTGADDRRSGPDDHTPRVDTNSPASRHELAAESTESGEPVQRRPADVPGPLPPPPPRTARPRIVDDTSILGITRHSRSRLGSRMFTLFFVFVFALILVQLIASLLLPYP